MAADREQRNQQRQRREAARKKRARAQRQMTIRMAVAAVVLLLCGGVIWWVSTGSGPAAEDPSTTAPGKTVQPEVPKSGTTVIHIAAGGDLLVTDRVVESGKSAGGYDYTQALLDAAPLLSNADLSILNFEGNLCGAPYGTDTASAPRELATALADIGVDVVQMANSTAIHNGLLGLGTTLNEFSAAGIQTVGAWGSQEQFRASKGYTIREVQGIKIAIVAFTKGMNNLGLPDGSENCVNLLYDDYATTYSDVATQRIRRVLQAAAQEQPDYTIALLHWGSEYNEEISSTQEDIRDIMLDEGVDAIIGTHPHLVQEITYNREEGTLVAYSLGDFFGDGEKAGSNYSVLLDLEITRDNVTGQTRLTNYSTTPLYILKPEESGAEGLRLARIEQAIAAYESDALERVTEEAYQALTHALQRIGERTSGEG